MPWDELRDLIGHLPRESALQRAVLGESARWGEVEHLLAVLIDLAQAQLWMTTAVNTPKGKRPKRPRPYPRPGVEDPSQRRFRGRRMSLADAAAWMERRRRGER